MTWTKLSDDFADRAARAGLSDAAFRTHVEAVIWTMRRETAGLLDRRDIRRACETADPDAAVAELVAAAWWGSVDAARWQIIETMGDQPEPEVIAARRRMDAERQRRKRRRAAQLDSGAKASRRDDPHGNDRNVRREDPRDPGRVGSGRAGKPAPTTKGEQAPVALDPAAHPNTCLSSGCSRPTRRACSTCFDHAYLEMETVR